MPILNPCSLGSPSRWLDAGTSAAVRTRSRPEGWGLLTEHLGPARSEKPGCVTASSRKQVRPRVAGRRGRSTAKTVRSRSATPALVDECHLPTVEHVVLRLRAFGATLRLRAFGATFTFPTGAGGEGGDVGARVRARSWRRRSCSAPGRCPANSAVSALHYLPGSRAWIPRPCKANTESAKGDTAAKVSRIKQRARKSGPLG